MSAQMEFYQSILDNPNITDPAAKRRIMLAMGRESGQTTADSGAAADAYRDQYVAANPQLEALRQTQMDAFLANQMGGVPAMNQNVRNMPIQANQGIQGIQGPSATQTNNTLSPVIDRMTQANGGMMPTGVLSATGPGSVTSIPAQQMQQMRGLNTAWMQGGLLGGGQAQGGLLGAPQTPQRGIGGPSYPMYGQPQQVRHTPAWGQGSRFWMEQGIPQALGQMNSYLQSQQNPASMPAPAVLSAFDKWREGQSARAPVAQQAPQQNAQNPFLQIGWQNGQPPTG